MQMKRWKQRLSSVLVLAMVLGFLPAGTITAYAEETEIETGVTVNPLYEGALDATTVEAELQAQTTEASASTEYTSLESAAEYVRAQMVARNSSIAFYLSNSVYEQYGTEVFNKIFDKAIECTNASTGQEGDALAFGWKGMSYSMSKESNNRLKVTYSVQYYTTKAQEDALTAKVKAAMKEIPLSSAADSFEEIDMIHDYVCDNVDYDYTYSKYSAYDALCNGTAVCQGYAVLFYRLCKEAGYPVRIISGTSDSGAAHAWNIVGINGEYYNVDCTWDGQDSYTYDLELLKSERDFEDSHIRDNAYVTLDFITTYPMAAQSYFKADEAALNAQNYNYSFVTIDDGTVSSSASNGRAKVVIFFNTGCGYSQNAIESISNADFSNVDIIAVDAHKNTKDNVKKFKDTYGNDSITFSYNTGSLNNMAMWSYVEAKGATGASYPVIAYIDGNNKLQHVSTGTLGMASEVKQKLAYYCGVEEVKEVVSATSITMESSVNMKVGDTHKLTVYVRPADADITSVVWDCGDIVSIGRDGTMEAVKAGTGTVAFWVCDANGQASAKAECTVTVTSKDAYTGLKKEDGQWVYYNEGVVDKKKYGFVEYGGGKFLVANGTVATKKSGLAQDPKNTADWYFLSQGQVQTQYTGLAQYDGAWFYVSQGKLDTTMAGYVAYDTGLFFVGAGRIMTEVSGLSQDPVTGKWYYLAEGQAQTQYTGLVKYDGEWFYIKNGVLAEDYTGTVKYNGSKFKVVNGMVKN